MFVFPSFQGEFIERWPPATSQNAGCCPVPGQAVDNSKINIQEQRGDPRVFDDYSLEGVRMIFVLIHDAVLATYMRD